jgi:alanyl-tRNA synthetase
MTSQQIRQQFIDFFAQRHGHTFVPSSPVVPHDDPTLLFTNAGMNQFKPIFLGQEKRCYTRAVNTQKCIRAGGKHNDLDDVGRSRRHHTFFEMLGNWSFGDYFKRGTIEMSWELLTKVWKLDPSRIHVSCYEGDEKNGVPRDTEAAQIWKEVAQLPDDHIHYFGADNFWAMGDTGPCGPCTEIYYDRTPDKSGRDKVNGDDPRVMEIWNNVFIQYNRDAAGKLTTLPAQHVDTGMGLERICQVLQDKQDNYATDIWTPLFEKMRELSGSPYAGKFPKTNTADPQAEAADEQLRHDIALRVVADHARCLTFAITDGAVPSNEGRGYVLRRILRRAVRFGRQQLGLHEPFMHKLVPVIVESMGGAFPELKKNPQHVADLIKDEEVSFGKTLDRGIQLFERAAFTAVVDAFNDHSPRSINRGGSVYLGSQFGRPMTTEEAIRHWQDEKSYPLNDRNELVFVSRKGDVVDLSKPERTLTTADFGPDLFKELQIPQPVAIRADHAFKLHDTYGFPIDLTRIMAEERGMTVDIAGYEKLMEEAKERARAGGKEQDTRLTDLPPEALAQLAQQNVKPTDDQPKFSHDPVQAKVMAIWNGDDLGLSPANVCEDEDLAVILDKTNFYAEMGGQVGDTGTLTKPTSGVVASATTFDIQTTKVVGGFVLHVGRVRNGKLQVGDTITATVANVRTRTEQNHTSTHIANWALRETLGDGVQQKGSLVDPEKLRFDFSHPKSLTDDELAKVETLVNQQISQKLPVYIEVAPQEQALKINGLRAVFGEKYPPMVRVVSIGAPVKDLLTDPTNAKWRQFSIEFCGGTHLKRSDEAQTFTITAEESVSKGIRRIVALTGLAASAASNAASNVDKLIAQAKEVQDSDLPAVIASLNESLSAGNLPLRAKRRAQSAVTELQSRYKAFEKTTKAQSSSSNVDAIAVANELLSSAPSLGPGKLIVGEIPGATDDQLRSAIDSLKKKTGSYGVLLAAANGEKVTFVAAVSDDLIAKGLKAGDWVRETAKIAGGGGGGRPQMAQAGGKDPAKLNDALAKAREFAASAVQ